MTRVTCSDTRRLSNLISVWGKGWISRYPYIEYLLCVMIVRAKGLIHEGKYIGSILLGGVLGLAGPFVGFILPSYLTPRANRRI
jgi:hypothetical protein